MKCPVASQSSCASQIARMQDGTPAGKGAGNLECSARIKGLSSANRDVEKAVNALCRDRDFSIFLQFFFLLFICTFGNLL